MNSMSVLTRKFIFIGALSCTLFANSAFASAAQDVEQLRRIDSYLIAPWTRLSLVADLQKRIATPSAAIAILPSYSTLVKSEKASQRILTELSRTLNLAFRQPTITLDLLQKAVALDVALDSAQNQEADDFLVDSGYIKKIYEVRRIIWQKLNSYNRYELAALKKALHLYYERVTRPFPTDNIFSFIESSRDTQLLSYSSAYLFLRGQNGDSTSAERAPIHRRLSQLNLQIALNLSAKNIQDFNINSNISNIAIDLELIEKHIYMAKFAHLTDKIKQIYTRLERENRISYSDAVTSGGGYSSGGGYDNGYGYGGASIGGGIGGGLASGYANGSIHSRDVVSGIKNLIVTNLSGSLTRLEEATQTICSTAVKKNDVAVIESCLNDIYKPIVDFAFKNFSSSNFEGIKRFIVGLANILSAKTDVSKLGFQCIGGAAAEAEALKPLKAIELKYAGLQLFADRQLFPERRRSSPITVSILASNDPRRAALDLDYYTDGTAEYYPAMATLVTRREEILVVAGVSDGSNFGICIDCALASEDRQGRLYRTEQFFNRRRYGLLNVLLDENNAVEREISEAVSFYVQANRSRSIRSSATEINLSRNLTAISICGFEPNIHNPDYDFSTIYLDRELLK